MTSDQVAVSHEGPVAILRIAPPDGFMTADTLGQYGAALEALEAADETRVVIVTGGRDDVFIRHYAVVELEKLANRLREKGQAFSEDRLVPEGAMDRAFERPMTMTKPVIAAINGFAMGGGFELTLFCDIRIAAEGDYQIGLPEVRIGLLPGQGAQYLARIIGPERALEFILRGRTVAPEEARTLGLIHEVAPAPVLNRALTVANQLAGHSPLAMAHIKRLVRIGSRRPFAEARALERTLFLDLLVSDEAVERMHRMNAQGLDIRRVDD